MDQQITTIEANELITDKERVRRSILLLVATHRQNNCKDIVTFVWWLYVSYRFLNSITLIFEFPILRYADSIEDLSDSRGSLSVISLDVHKMWQENFDFFIPCAMKNNFKVMPFGSKNNSSIYTAMMQTIRKEWIVLFSEIRDSISITIYPTTMICDDILFF